MKLYDQHTHSHHSHESNTVSSVEELCRGGMDAGLSGIVVTDHYDIRRRPREVVTQQLRSSRDPLARSFVMIGTSPYYPEFADPTFRLYAHYMPKCIDLRRFGAAAWEMCLAASGRTGLFLELHLQLWDYAAGALIAQEAGCRVTDIEANPLRYTGPSSVAIASEGVSGEDYLEGTAEILAGIGKDRA